MKFHYTNTNSPVNFPKTESKMNERILELVEKHGFIHEHMTTGERNDALRKYKEFAELLYKDIITIVAAQALSNHSALDVFKNLKRIYEEEN